MYEICDHCKECQLRHVKKIRKEWKVRCKGIPKELWEDGYYPLEKVLEPKVYNSLTTEDKIKLQYKNNILLWAEHKLGWSPYNPKRKSYQYWQKEMLLCTSKSLVGRLGRRMGKCTHPDTYIQTDHGPIMAKNLNNNKHKIYTFDENEKKLFLTNDFITFDNGIKQIYQIKTKMGNEDKVTYNHPYLIFRNNEFKWIEAKDIKLNDRICVTKSYEKLLPISEENKALFRTLGYLISDGGTNYKDQTRFTNFDPILIKDFNKILKENFFVRLHRYSKGNYGIKRLPNQKINLINKLCNEHDLRHLSINKKVPSILFNTSKENISHFLSSAWDCDGWIDNQGAGYCSSSKELAIGIKHLLKKLSIQSTLKTKKVKYKDSYNLTYQVDIRGLENLIKFQKDIKLILKGNKLDNFINNRKKGINSYEILPIEINQYIKNKFKEKNISLSKSNIIIKNFERISIEKLIKINNILKDQFLSQFINGEFILDEVKEINILNEESSIGITVNKTHTFITDDIWTHNTEVLCIKAIHFIDTTEIKNANLMIVGPFQNLLEEIFDRLKLMLDSDKSVFAGNYRSTKKPYTIQLGNNKILGFTTGTKSGSEGASTRGQRADELMIDEADYMGQKDIETVMALRMEHSNFRVTITSTPAAIPGLFRKFCNISPEFKDFHFPSTLMPSYESQKEEILSMYNKDGFAREILAEFYEDSSKVFSTEDIRSSFVQYEYVNHINQLDNPNEWITTVGVDWNSFKNGVTICVLGWNKRTQKLRVLNTEIIRKANDEDEEKGFKHLQSASIQKIIEKFSNFEAKAVYVDEGYGGYQCEFLEKYFYDIGYPEIFKKINFGSALKQINSFTGETISKRLKGVLVYSLQQQFEKSRIELSPIEEGNIENIDARFEDKIVYQLQFYAVDHYDGKDNPVFVNKGDHMLDALMLANYAFVEKVEKSIDFLPEKLFSTNTNNNIINKKSSFVVQRSGFLETMEDIPLTIPEIKQLDDPSQVMEEMFKSNDYRVKKNNKLFGSKKIKRTSFL